MNTKSLKSLETVAPLLQRNNSPSLEDLAGFLSRLLNGKINGTTISPDQSTGIVINITINVRGLAQGGGASVNNYTLLGRK